MNRSRTKASTTFFLICFFAFFGIASASAEALDKNQSTAAPGAPIDAEVALSPKAFNTGYTAPIYFSEVGNGSILTDQYKSRGIIFGPDTVYTAHDYASAQSPVLSGTPIFRGPISGSFVDPENPTRKIGASAIKMRVGYMDEKRTVRLYLYDKDGKLLSQRTTTIKDGFENFHVELKDKLFFAWKIQTVANEPAGFAIDNFSAKLQEKKDIVAHIKIDADMATSPGSSPEPTTGKNITLTVELKDSAGKKLDYPITECQWANIPDFASGKMGVEEGDPAHDCRLTYQYKATEGPKDDSYGAKRITFTGKVITDEGGEQDVKANQSFKVFFDKAAIDDTDNNAPNWFVYWGKNNSVPGLADSHVYFNDVCAGYGYATPGDGKVFICAPAAETHYPGKIVVPNKTFCPGGTFGDAKGINSVREVLVHENEHIKVARNWQPGGAWVGLADSDDPTPTKSDIYGDHLPDSFEAMFGTDPNQIDSCGLAWIRAADYAYYGDQEFYVMHAANNQKGSSHLDWANPGSNTKPAFKFSQNEKSAPPKAEKTFYSSKVLDPYQFENYPIGDIDAGGIPDYRFSGIYSAELTPEYLAIRTSVYLARGSENGNNYIVYADLAGSDGKAFLEAAAHINNPISGNNEIELRFDAKQLKTYGKSGTFILRGIRLLVVDRYKDGHVLDTRYGHLFETPSYDLDTIPYEPSRFSETISDKGIDADGNGKFESIALDVEIDMAKAGTYRIRAQTQTYVSGEITMQLNAGKNKITIPLDLGALVENRYKDPIILTRLSARDSADNLVADLQTRYPLQTQGFDRFEKPSAVRIHEASFTDYPVDIDGEPGADFIALDVDVTTTLAGEYLIAFEVQDQNGNLITEEENYIDLAVGTRRLYLSIPTDPFFQKKTNGPYLIRFFSVFDDNYLSVDSLQNFVYETQAYRFSDFQPFEPPTERLSFGAGSAITTGAAIKDGDVYVWGFRGSAQQGNGKTAVPAHYPPAKVASLFDIAVLTGGAYHMLALGQNGDVYGWGQSGYGETGCGTGYVATPCITLSDAAQIAAGEYFSVARDNAGQVYTWGHNAYGQLGDGTSRNSKVPVAVKLNGEKARLIGGAYEGAFAVTEDGHVWAWGDNEGSGLGIPGSKYGVQKILRTPTRALDLEPYAADMVYIGGGNGWGEALLKDGRVIGWGTHAALGIGVQKTNVSSPVPVEIMSNIRQLHARYVGSVALTNDGEIYTWGITGGSAFAMIYGHTATKRETHDKPVVAIGGGKEHVFYQTDNGDIYGVGYNDLYKLNQSKCCAPSIGWPGVKINF